MKIKRTIATKIMSQATQLTNSCFLAILQNEDIIHAHNIDGIKQLMSEHPQSILVYNQSPQSAEIKDNIEYTENQKTIEIFQDTRGVFGLRAYRQRGKLQTPVTLELSD